MTVLETAEGQNLIRFGLTREVAVWNPWIPQELGRRQSTEWQAGSEPSVSLPRVWNTSQGEWRAALPLVPTQPLIIRQPSTKLLPSFLGCLTLGTLVYQSTQNTQKIPWYTWVFSTRGGREIHCLKCCLVLFFNTELSESSIGSKSSIGTWQGADVTCNTFWFGNRYSEGKRIFFPMHIAGAKEIAAVLVGGEVALAWEHTDISTIMICGRQKKIL